MQNDAKISPATGILLGRRIVNTVAPAKLKIQELLSALVDQVHEIQFVPRIMQCCEQFNVGCTQLYTRNRHFLIT